MDLLNNPNLKPKMILKIFGIAILGIIVLAFALKLISSSFGNIGSGEYGSRFSANDMAYQKSSTDNFSMSSESATKELSLRNVNPSQAPSTPGADAENYEVTEYSAAIETRNLKKACQSFFSLKSKDYVIFENANEGERSCNYSFKAAEDKKEEVLAIIKDLDPKELSANTQTIKNAIEDFTSEEEILAKKKQTVEETLNKAINSYDEIAKVATQARDAESLAKIIDSKINIIEKLSAQRIDISEQLDRLSRAKAEQLDRLDYIYFNVYVYENKFVDGELIRDSWKNELKSFFSDTNDIIQNSSIGLIRIIFYVLQFALYILAAAIAAKFGWKIIKKIWIS